MKLRCLLAAGLACVAAPAMAQSAPTAAKATAAKPAPKGPPPKALIAVLDKRTGAVTDLEVAPGEPFTAGRLSGVMHDCQRRPPPAARETAAFLELSVTPRGGAAGKPPQPGRVFSGWMFVESPSLNPLRHPAYDVWVRNCTIAEPEIAVAPPASRASPRTASPARTRPAPSNAPQSADDASASSSNER